MPKTNEVPSSAALAPDEGVTIPRIKLAEQGVVGLKTSNKHIIDEANAAFRYPNFVKTVAEMRNNPTVGAAMNVYRMMLARPKWYVKPPADATEVEKERANIVQTMMHDMDDTWESFINSLVPYLEYGFGVNEKVMRRRLPKNGSKYSDGLVGIGSLPVRNQETVTGWVFSEDGSQLTAVEQTVNTLENGYIYAKRTNENGKLVIDREKFLLFSASATRGNPQGNSLFRNIYLAFKQLSLLQDQELLSCAKDIQGILKIEVPAKYLDPSQDQTTAKAFQTIIDQYNLGTQRGLLVPGDVDPQTNAPLFKYDLMESKGVPKQDIEKIIQRLQSDILSALSVDVLKLGADGTGSFSLADAKTSVLALAIDYRLREIASVLNFDLMRTIYAMNGWSQERLPEFAYEDVEDIDVAEFSAAIQRIFAVSAIEVDRAVLNRIRHVLGVPTLPEDLPVQEDLLPANMTGQDTKSASGMAVGVNGDGTAKSASKGDKSVANKENKA